MLVVGKHFGKTASNVRVEIDGVQCTDVEMVTPHTKVRCIAPRMRLLSGIGSTIALSDERRAPHLTPPPEVTSKRRRKKNGRERANSGDERRQLIVSVSNQSTRSEMTYVNEGQHDALQSAQTIENRQRRGSRKNRSRKNRPASTPPRAYATARPERAPWLPDEHVVSCMICIAAFGFFKRKHHCRNCGVVVCAGCSKHTQYVEAYGTLQRVCDRCHDNIKGVEEEVNLLKNRIEHIATMRSIEAGKKRKFERDLVALNMQEPKASEEDIRALEARISEQDRRVASKQNSINKTQQKLLDLTVNGNMNGNMNGDMNGNGSTSGSSRGGGRLPDRYYSATDGTSTLGDERSSLGTRSMRDDRSMPPSPASSTSGRRTPVRYHHHPSAPNAVSGVYGVSGAVRPYSATGGVIDGRSSVQTNDSHQEDAEEDDNSVAGEDYRGPTSFSGAFKKLEKMKNVEHCVHFVHYTRL